MRLAPTTLGMLAVAAILSVFAIGCSDGAAAPTPAPTPTSVPVPTATPAVTIQGLLDVRGPEDSAAVRAELGCSPPVRG